MVRTALIDADILRYECASVGEDKSFDFVKEVFDERVRTIVEGSGSEDYRLFITADKTTFRIAERALGKGTLGVYRPNYREELAVGKVYKGTRKQDKPFHWLNLTAYILS